jgi:hypothetical protein
MKFEIRTVVALIAGLALYIALSPDFETIRHLVDCVVMAELLSRIVKTRQV